MDSVRFRLSTRIPLRTQGLTFVLFAPFVVLPDHASSPYSFIRLNFHSGMARMISMM